MKLILALAFVAVAAALPEPIRLPVPVQPQVVEAVKFVDSPLSEVSPQAAEVVAPQAEELPQVDAVKVAYFAPRDEGIPVEAVKVAHFAPESEGIPVEAVKVAHFAPEAKNIPIDAVKVAHFARVQPVEAEDEGIPVEAVKVAHFAPKSEGIPVEAVKVAHFAPKAENIPVDAVKVAHFVRVQPVEAVVEDSLVNAIKIAHAPLEVAPQAEEIKVDAVKFVDAPVQDEVNIAREPKLLVATPVVLPSAALPVVQDFQYGVKVVDAPQQAPMIDISPMIVPQQIMDVIKAAEQAHLDAAGQRLPLPGHIFVNPLLR